VQNLISLWQALDAKKRIIVAGATIAVFLAVLGVARIASAPGMSLLYAGLQGGAAGDVVAALEQDGVAFEVRGDSIYVDSRRRDSERLRPSRFCSTLQYISCGKVSRGFRVSECATVRAVDSHTEFGRRIGLVNNGRQP
jgi:hypothetical protein